MDGDDHIAPSLDGDPYREVGDHTPINVADPVHRPRSQDRGQSRAGHQAVDHTILSSVSEDAQTGRVEREGYGVRGDRALAQEVAKRVIRPTEVRLEHPQQGMMRNEPLAAAQLAEEELSLSGQLQVEVIGLAPQRRQAAGAHQSRLLGQEEAVDRTGRGPDDQLGVIARSQDRLQRSYLKGTVVGRSAEDQGAHLNLPLTATRRGTRFHCTDGQGRGQDLERVVDIRRSPLVLTLRLGRALGGLTPPLRGCGPCGCYNAAMMPDHPEPVAGAPAGAPNPAVTPQIRDPRYIQIKRSHLFVALVLVAFGAGLGSGYLAWGRGRTAQPVLQESTAGVQQRFDVSTDGDPSIGPDDAPVTIVEFSDFNCPYCRKFHQETFEGLMSAYGDRIRFVYRDFPITSAESFVAAQAANCAGRQGAYWPFHNALFSGSLGLGRAAYEAYAQQLGLDVQALGACLDSGEEAAEVTADARTASELGVTGTPTFFINGIALVGAQPLTEFSRVIEDELGS